MGHDHHFLSRLDRVDDDDVELALGLYRDHELVKLILEYHSVYIPESAPRVAIALDDSGEGPFLIVARDGHFVTCLARGMLPHDAPLITREQLDRCAISLTAARGGTPSDARRTKGEFARIFQRITSAGNAVSREDMRTLVMFSPLIERAIGTMFRNAAMALGESTMRVGLITRLHRSNIAPLEAWWKATWCAGAVLPLMALRDARQWDDIPHSELRSIGWAGFGQGVMPVAMRTAWAVGRAGPSLLETSRGIIDEAEGTVPMILNGIMTALVTALRYPRLESEAREILSPERVSSAIPPGRSMREWVLQWVEFAQQILHDPEAKARDVLKFGRVVAASPDGLGYASPEEVPDDIALCSAIDARLDYLGDRKATALLVLAAPLLARAQPEDLFYPSSMLARRVRPYSPERALELAEPLRNALEKPTRVPKQATPRPNDPCSCGSGKKYKRCCGSVVTS